MKRYYLYVGVTVDTKKTIYTDIITKA